MTKDEKKPLILVADDERTVRQILCLELQRKGYATIEAENGIQAIGAMEQGPDLVLLDVMMPGMDGLEVCGLLRSRSSDNNVPILMITSLTDRDVVEKAFRAGATDYITKPINFGILGQRVARLIEARRLENKLRENEEKYRTLISECSDGIFIFDPQTWVVEEANASFLQMTGYNEGEVTRLRVDDFVFDLPEVIKARINQVLAKGQCIVDEIQYKRKDGSLIDVEVSAKLIGYGREKVVMSIVRDISERKHMEQRLQLAATVIDNIPNGVVVMNARGEIVSINQGFTSLTGYTEGEMMEGNRCLLDKILKGKLQDLLLKEQWGEDINSHHKEGQSLSFLVNISMIKDRRGQPNQYVFVFSDMTERKRYEQQMKHRAHHDFLTGLPNRLLFHKRLGMALSGAAISQHSVAVMFLDLDNFKRVNDDYGHKTGDLLLQIVAKRLAACLRKGDTIARMGGDEFTVILPGIDGKDNIAVVAQKLLDVFKQPFILDDNRLDITTSIGISVYPQDGDELNSLMKKADMAMYWAKDQGKNKYQFYTNE